ncbi:hypothetical protein A3K86_19420 [Photobacterium jeanii]|uniref:PepSY domain-containing protein n=1 Tax=Photobacterium jeanii TaxID=858640 RepID=A0A178K204_9GAMM|nr:PepSY domain-containing protein [Photobacterium jeanii]OAN11137.1 hypothetical protein A3K86_19420 [Photobacterium jeanii]PST90656.1 PepSY domain-containing protein [Photobacterium jeanii]
MNVVKHRLIGLAVFGFMVSGSVLADPVSTMPKDALTVQKAMRLLQNQGYYDFRKIKIEHDENEIEVEARNKLGNKVEVELDLFSGQILTIEHD